MTKPKQPLSKRVRRQIFWKADKLEESTLNFLDSFAKRGHPLPKKVYSQAYEVLTFYTSDRAKELTCDLLGGHEGTSDHCGMPHHDFCLFCQKRLPFQGESVEQRIMRLVGKLLEEAYAAGRTAGSATHASISPVSEQEKLDALKDRMWSWMTFSHRNRGNQTPRPD